MTHGTEFLRCCKHQGWPVELAPSSDESVDELEEIFPDLELEQILTAKDGCLVLREKLLRYRRAGRHSLSDMLARDKSGKRVYKSYMQS